ncbi:MAG: GxxExxY protein [Flavisolibacter sp.]
MKYEELTGKIIGCAMKVHSYFGMGFTELIYHRSLVVELEKMGLQSEGEIEKNIFYSGICVGKKRLDLIVEDKVLIELKAVPELNKGCFRQLINYLKVFNMEVGLLLNFGSASLQFKRFVN